MIETYAATVGESLGRDESLRETPAGTDAELMRRVAAHGDREAFTQLVDRYKDPLVGYLARLAGCPERAQDLAQESFLRLYRAASRYRESGNLRAYLYRIATNLLRSEERRARRWRKVAETLPAAPAGAADPALPPLTDESWMTGSERPDGEERVLRRERSERLARAVAALPLNYREVLVLSEIEELPQREIAELLGCREGTVKSRLFRARRRLRRELAPYWDASAAGTESEPGRRSGDTR